MSVVDSLPLHCVGIKHQNESAWGILLLTAYKQLAVTDLPLVNALSQTDPAK